MIESDFSGRLASVETRIESQGRELHGLTEAIKDLAEKVSGARATNWGWIISAAGLVVVIGGMGHTFVTQLVESESQARQAADAAIIQSITDYRANQAGRQSVSDDYEARQWDRINRLEEADGDLAERIARQEERTGCPDCSP